MPKVLVKTVHDENDWDVRTRTELYVDGEHVETGYYGGEPEDNSYHRDYSWVETMVEKLAKRLGAEVVNEVVTTKGR